MKKIILFIFALCLGFFNIAFGYSNNSRPDLEISDITYNSDAGQIAVKIYNRWNANITSSFRIKIETSGETNYYYVSKDIWSNNYITLNYNIDNFNIDWERAFIKAEVDIDDSINESDESNNDYSDYIYFDYSYHEGYNENLADLEVKDVIYNSTDDELKIQLFNNGDDDVNWKFRVKIVIANKTYYYYFNGLLKANNSKRVNVNIYDANIKNRWNYNAKIEIDDQDQIDESSESNNTYTKSIYIYKSNYSDNSSSYDDDEDYDYNDNYYNKPDCYYDYYYCNKNKVWLPDLKVWSITYDSSDEVLSIRIDNTWKKYLDDKFKIKIELNWYNYYYYFDERINNWSYKWLKINVDEFDLYKTWTYNVRVSLDTNKEIKEWDESNNSLSSSVYFDLNDDDDDDDDDNRDYNTKIDLYVSQIKFDDYDDEMIVRIKNKWSTEVRERFKMKIEVDGYTYYFYVDELIWKNDYIDYSISIDNLNIRKNKTYKVKVRLDINNNIAENDEDNNDYSANVPFND